MKKLIKPNHLPYFTLTVGILGLLLRQWLFSTGMDNRDLLVSRHPGAVLSWVLAAVGIGILFLSTRGLDELPKRKRQPACSLPGCIGTLAAAAGIAATELTGVLSSTDLFSLISGILGIAAAVCLCVMSYCHLRGKASAFGLYLVVVAYFLFHLVCQYRQWSWASQLLVYVFPLVASIFLMLASYHRAALETPMGRWGSYLFCTQTAALFCCFAIPGRKSLFYPAMAVWMLLSPFSVKFPARGKEDSAK